MKRPGLAAVYLDGHYEGLVELVLGGEADGTACPPPAQSCRRCVMVIIIRTSAVLLLRKDFAKVLEAGHFF
ncbi:hypothetical protein DPMN_088304 [Dreissena polymorpha]|uniref:Uncharacterized protein n=1 Tax=Dreissena polymorpha TaxID=45954 RepID=A0A9D4KTW4_DREPO|nr:hypothetical protein DPMN_088304 [Dreissena polymorpha]